MFLLKTRYIIPMALVAGLLASYGVYSYLKQQQERLQMPPIENRQVVVAAANLLMGATLNAEEMEVREWPKNLVPEGALQEIKTGEGRVLKTDVIAGEAILESKLAPVGSSGGVTSLIPPGMRAVTVAVDVVSGVGGFVLPKTRVDVLAIVAPSGKREEAGTKMILQNIQVLAIDQTYKKSDDDQAVTVKSVTVLVSPAEAEKLALVGNEAKLQLTLRNSADHELHSTEGVQLSQLLGRAEVAPRQGAGIARPAPKMEVTSSPKAGEESASRRVVEVIRANVRSEMTFEEETGSNDQAKEAKKKPSN